MKIPGEFLSSVLIDINRKQAPNKPLYAINKRAKVSFGPKTKRSSVQSSTKKSTIMVSFVQPPSLLPVISSTTITTTTQLLTSSHSIVNLSLDDFQSHIPSWGAKITYKGLKNVNVSDTCTIDYFLFSFWAISKTDKGFVSNLPALDTSIV